MMGGLMLLSGAGEVQCGDSVVHISVADVRWGRNRCQSVQNV